MAFYSNPKRKTYVLNPRGKALYEDSSRFGTKMLEKMGWSKGKGLGANLDGQLDFIKVSHKGDQKGVGFLDRDDQWTAHENNFNSLLKSFDKSAEQSDAELEEPKTVGFGFKDDRPDTKNATKKEDIFSGVSLEEQSKKSRARVHYKKFTRGKDMSKYSEKDLANIFGKKTLNVCETVETLVTEPEPTVDNDSTVEEKKFGVDTIETGLSIQDYFKAKMEALRNGGKKLENIFPADEEIIPKKKSKKSKSVVENCDQTIDLTKKHKKKKNKNIENDAIEIPTDELLASDSIMDFSTLSNENVQKKKINKHKLEHNDEIKSIECNGEKKNGKSVEYLAEEELPMPEPIEIGRKKKEKRKKCLPEVVDENIEIETNVKKSKKRKLQAVDDVDCVIVAESQQENQEHQITKAKKKKKRKEADDKEVNTQHSDLTFERIFSQIINVYYNKDLKSQPSTAHQAFNKTAASAELPFQPENDNVYVMSNYRAEIFRFVDLDGFENSNLGDIAGYGYTDKMQLKAVPKKNDEKNICTFWDEALQNKYGKEMIRIKRKRKYKLTNVLKKKMFRPL